MPDKQRRFATGALVTLGGVGMALGVDLDAAAQGEVLGALDGAYAAGAALCAALAVVVSRFKA